MFGYVKPFQPELKVRELDTYKAVYCGLCKELGRSFGPFARLTLSYDFAFLAVLRMALEPEEPCFAKCRCALHPLSRRSCCKENPAERFSAAAAMILFYYKLKDDLADRGFFKKFGAALMFPLAAMARRRALAVEPCAPSLDEAALRMMHEQVALESERCPSVDRAAEPTALFLEHTLGLLSGDEAQKRVLMRFGYLFGRYIYLCDAADDLDDDRKKRNYNPFLCSPRGESELVHARASLNSTIAELAATSELLALNRYKGIIDNIVYLGLRAEVTSITEKKERNRE